MFPVFKFTLIYLFLFIYKDENLSGSTDQVTKLNCWEPKSAAELKGTTDYADENEKKDLFDLHSLNYFSDASFSPTIWVRKFLQ